MNQKTHKKGKRGRQLRRMSAFLLVRLLLSMSALAADPNYRNEDLLQAITNMQQRQESEENSVVRLIQQPVAIQMDSVCSPVEQARQRIQDLGGAKSEIANTITVEAGHKEVTVQDNHGSIDNSVNVQVVNPNEEKRCL